MKATISDPDTNRPIVIGDGLVPQIERYASKYAYTVMTPAVMTTAMDILIEKAEKDTGNEFLLICNAKMWRDIQISLGSWLNQLRPIGTYLWSKGEGGYVDVGATYQSYEFAGKELLAA